MNGNATRFAVVDCNTAFGELPAAGPDLGIPAVKIHNAGDDWRPALASLARAHPDLAIVVAHGGGRGAGPFFCDLPNVHFEFCSSEPERGVLAECVAAVGPRRVLFGSDADLLSPQYVLGTYADAEIEDEVAPLIYRENAMRLFAL